MALAAGLVCMIAWGYRMWWQRRPTRGFAAPYARGTWRAVPPAVLLPVAAAAIAVGAFVPLLGISLLAFLVVDAVLGRRPAGPDHGRRHPATTDRNGSTT
ncbi:hypothetical protein [Planomonospora algeriensis]